VISLRPHKPTAEKACVPVAAAAEIHIIGGRRPVPLRSSPFGSLPDDQEAPIGSRDAAASIR
jgi:hypothetical protein